MNAPQVILDLEDDGSVETFPVFHALRGLAMVHQLPKAQRVHHIRRRSGETLVFITVNAEFAEEWRAALGAAAYVPVQQPIGVQYSTERFWFGAKVKLSYSLAVIDRG